MATGCASPTVIVPPPLPFHVAVIPVQIDSVDRAPSLSPAQVAEGVEDTRVQLAFLSDGVSSELAGLLEAECFTRASLLPYPRGTTRDSFRELDLAVQDEHWVAAARALGTDLIVECSVSYDPSVRTATNDRFWPNVLLFLLGGPFCWFTDDRSYYFDSRVDLRVYDLAATHVGSGAGLADQPSRLLSKQRVFNETTLDFMDRAGSNAGYFALSLIWPAGLLASDSDGAHGHLQQKIIAQLCQDVVAEIRQGADALMGAEQLVHFQPRDLEVVNGPEGLELRGTVVLRLGEVDRLQGYRCILRDGETVQGRFGEGAFEPGEGRRGATLRYTLVVPLPPSASQGSIQLQIIESRRDQITRTFTVPAPAPEKQ